LFIFIHRIEVTELGTVVADVLNARLSVIYQSTSLFLQCEGSYCLPFCLLQRIPEMTLQCRFYPCIRIQERLKTSDAPALLINWHSELTLCCGPTSNCYLLLWMIL